MSRGSTCRDAFAAMGHPHSLAVYRANKAVARKGFGRGDNVQGVYEIKKHNSFNSPLWNHNACNPAQEHVAVIAYSSR